jgi:hypothetical protein
VSTLLPALAVAFAAFCVWLGVRVYNRRERWAKWTLAAICGCVFGYPLSAGPILLINVHFLGESQVIDALYHPLFWLAESGPEWSATLLLTYLSLFGLRPCH